jgi:uncharacterized OB-fold protein
MTREECHYRPHTDGDTIAWRRIATVCGTCGRCWRYGHAICACRRSRKWALIDHRWRVGSWMLGPQQ